MAQHVRSLDPGASPLSFFGARLRTWRTRRGLSQAALGRMIHVSGDLIAKIEKAERRPAADMIVRLDSVLEADGDLVRAGTGLASARSALTRPPATPAADASRLVAADRTLAPEVLDGLRNVLTGCRHLDHALGPRAVQATVASQITIAEALKAASGGSPCRDLLLILAELHRA